MVLTMKPSKSYIRTMEVERILIKVQKQKIDGGNPAKLHIEYKNDDITWGTRAHYSPPLADWNQCCEIDTGKFVVGFNTGNRGRACVATVSDKTITFGSRYIFSEDISCSKMIGVCKIATDKFVVVYADVTQDFDTFARVGTVSGTVITWGSATEIYDGDGEWFSCCLIAANKFAVCYNDEAIGDHQRVIICTVSDSAITAGSPVQYEAGKSPELIRCCKLDTDKLVVVYQDLGDASHAKACVITVSGTTPSPGTPVVLDDTGACSEFDCEQLDTDKFVVMWYNGATAYTAVGTVSGTGITWGSWADVGCSAQGPGMAVVDATRFVISCRDIDNSNKGETSYCTISGTTITVGSLEVFEETAVKFTDVCLINTDKVAVCYEDAALDNGYARAGDTPSAPAAGLENKSANMGAKMIAEKMI